MNASVTSIARRCTRTAFSRGQQIAAGFQGRGAPFGFAHTPSLDTLGFMLCLSIEVFVLLTTVAIGAGFVTA